jgi:TolB-like protein
MRLLAELQRRNVIRMAGLYLVIAWLIVQVAETLLPAFDVPGWVLRAVILLLAIGFIPALVFSWVFELTPQGLKREDEVQREPHGNLQTARKLDLAVIALLLGIGGLMLWGHLRSGDAPSQASSGAVVVDAAKASEAVVDGPPDKSIAVLPFADFSPGADQQWFADGLAEELLNALARTADLKVASRTASFAFRDSSESPQAIGEALKVAHVLEGSVRRAGGQLRVTAQLIRASDGFHLWSENFDGSVEDAIAIQEQIALKIAQALKTAMDPQALAAMVSAGTRSVEAYEAFLRAGALSAEMMRSADWTFVLDRLAELERAVAIDPGFSRAHGAIASIWLAQLSPARPAFGQTDLPPGALRRRFDLAIEAAIGAARSEAERLDYQAMQAGARVQLSDQIALRQRATAHSPEDALAWRLLGESLVAVGRYPEAREAVLTSVELGLGTARELSQAANLLHRADDAEAAVSLTERALAQPDFVLWDLYQAHRTLLHAGRVEQAAELARSYALRAGGSPSDLIVQLRQACAEGRLADAEAIYAASDTNDSNRWLRLTTLGRDAEARELLRPLDTPDQLYSLASYLINPQFDPGDFPLLADTLARQGIQRPPRPLPYACKQPGEPAP